MIVSKLFVAGTVAVAILVCGCADRSSDMDNVSSASGSTGLVQYHYDALGRLIQAVAPDGTSVQYSYDAVGNMTRVHRLSENTLSLVDFAPRVGTPGNAVTIHGSGFDPAATGNAVVFNGAAATVSAATETTLIVSVPAAATSGKITVSNTRGSVTSSADYVIRGASLNPAIVSFTPTVGTAGTQISLVGTNFQTNADNDKVTIGGQIASIVGDATSPTPSLLTVTVPSTSASGRIVLTTPFGKATSQGEFFSIPGTVNEADVEFKARLAVNGAPLTVSTTATGKKAVVLFDVRAGQQGQTAHIVTQSDVFTGSVSADLYGPDGVKIMTLPLSKTGVGDLPTPFTLLGTYTLILTPSVADQGTQISVVVDARGQLSMDGNTPITLLPGQNGRFSFTAEAGVGYGLAITGLTFAPGAGNLQVTLRKPDGTPLLVLSPFAFDADQELSPVNFATAGTYLIDFDPAGLNAAGLNVVLSKDSGGQVLNGTATVHIVRPGQNARFTLDTIAGHTGKVTLHGTLDDGDPTTLNNTSMLIFKPSSPNTLPIANGTLHQNDEKFGVSLILDVSAPETGTYTILINPVGLTVGNLQLKVEL
jgi:YD repeat-containing protein